jgi:Predicted membrane protein
MFFELLQLSASTILVYMLGWFLLAVLIKRFDIADIAWGLGFIVVAWAMYIRLESPSPSYLIVCILTTLWGIRLATHIFLRTIKKSEDFRYANWRKEWGAWANVRALFQVFLLQGFFMFIISFATFTIALTGPILDVFTYVGIAVWTVGFLFETVGDYQLAQFLKTKKERRDHADWSLAIHSPSKFTLER